MSEAYKINNPEHPHFITFSVFNWFPVFENIDNVQILLAAIKFYQINKKLEVYAFCIMPSHVHLILKNGVYDLAAIIRDLKRYTSREITKKMKGEEECFSWLTAMKKEADRLKRAGEFKFWQDGYHPVEIYSGWFFKQKLDYIHNNPVVNGLCLLPTGYIYSSASKYAGLKSDIHIEVLNENGDVI